MTTRLFVCPVGTPNCVHVIGSKLYASLKVLILEQAFPPEWHLLSPSVHGDVKLPCLRSRCSSQLRVTVWIFFPTTHPNDWYLLTTVCIDDLGIYSCLETFLTLICSPLSHLHGVPWTFPLYCVLFYLIQWFLTLLEVLYPASFISEFTEPLR